MQLKLNGVARATDESIIAVAENCRSILEIDLAGCHSISSASVTALLSNLPHLRELRLAQCVGIDSHAFTDLKNNLKFDALRILDLTACDGVGDDAIKMIIPAAPRLRNLVLAKCRNITDQAVKAICTLTKNLHYIHLGHCQHLTDAAVIELVQQCNRIRYIDLACCSRLTDASVRHLAKLPKLRRVGLVKCQNLTDVSIIALARGPYGSGNGRPGMPTQFVSLERVHLSYCTSLTLKGITQLLLNCPRLTHLSLTGVQAFLRDDLTRFCREAPTEFTHVQRDVFCVFSGEGVERLREYLRRLFFEAQEREAKQQNAIDEQVVGPDSPDADSQSDGTIDGLEYPANIIFGPGRHGLPRISGTRPRQRRSSFHGLPHPNGFHIDMPLLGHDQMERIGPWTPGPPHMTPEQRPQPTPPFHPSMGLFGQHPGQPFGFQRLPSPLPTPHAGNDSQPRSRSQSRRHTMEESFFGPLSSRPHYMTGGPSRTPQQESEIFSDDHLQLPIFQTTMHGAPSLPPRPQTRRGPPILRPDPGVSSFEVNHEAILSTIPNSRGPSRGPSRSNSPHMSRVASRSRMGNFLSELRGVVAPSYADVASGRVPSSSRSRQRSGQRQQSERIARPEAIPSMSDEQLPPESYAGPSSSRRSHTPMLPPDLMQQVMMSPATPLSASSTPPRRGQSNDRRDTNTQGDINMIE